MLLKDRSTDTHVEAVGEVIYEIANSFLHYLRLVATALPIKWQN